MLKNFVKLFSGDPTKKTVEQFAGLVVQVNALEAQYEALSDGALRAKTLEFRERVAKAIEGVEDEQDRRKFEQDILGEIMPEAFAAVREASKRTIGLRHYDVQIIGGAALHSGQIAEMRTGEGKTLVSTMPDYLNTLTGRGVMRAGWRPFSMRLAFRSACCKWPLQPRTARRPSWSISSASHRMRTSIICAWWTGWKPTARM